MGGYIKRGIAYVLHEYKQPIVKISVVERPPNNLFTGKVFLVTGGSRGIGYAIAKRIIGEGGTVIITGRDEESLKQAKNSLGDTCNYVKFDIGETKSARKVIKDIFKKYKKIDGLVNNAGVSLHEWDFLKVDEKGYDVQFNTNLKGGYFLTQAYIEQLIQEKIGGNILFISSEAGTMVDDLPYGLTKASVNSLVKSLSYRFYKNGIRVNAVAPGVTATDMTGLKKDSDFYYNKPSGRCFMPEEVAEVAIFLLSEYSNCISGEIIHTNGGNHIVRRY